LLIIGVLRAVWTAAYRDTETLRGLTDAEAFGYTAVTVALAATITTNVDWMLYRGINQGSLTTQLTWPISLRRYLLGTCFGDGLRALAITFVPTIAASIVLLGMDMPSLEQWAWFAVSFVVAYLLLFHIDFLLGLITIRTHSIVGFIHLRTALIAIAAGSVLPYEFYPESVAAVLRWLPFAGVSYVPARLLTVEAVDTGEVIAFLVRQAAWLLIVSFGAEFAWRRSRRHLELVGG
jgi:ABC-2 type transport system permease protein